METPSEHLPAARAGVLIVDDDEISRCVAESLLSAQGFACDMAADGAQAVQMAAKRPYDIILMDHMMPGMDGVEATRQIRTDGQRDEARPVIIGLTGDDADAVRALFLEAGMDGCLSKPLDVEPLAHILRTAYPAHRAGEEPEARTASPSAREELARFQRAVPELDCAGALRRLGGMEQALTQALWMMARRLDAVSARLADFFARGDLSGFAIEVHGAKGSLNNVGAHDLAKEAEALELRAKKGDLAFCAAHTSRFLEGLESLRCRLGSVTSGKPGRPRPAGDPGELAQTLTLVRQLLEEFEQDLPLDLVQSAAKLSYGAGTDAFLEELSALIGEFALEEAIALIDGRKDSVTTTQEDRSNG